MYSIEDKLDKNKTNKILIASSIIIAMGGFLFGYDSGVMGPSLIYVKPFFHLNSLDVAIVVAGQSLLAAVGALIAGPVSDIFGRKKLLLVDAAIYGIFALTAALSISAIMLILSRSLIGLAIGADAAVATGYISEFSPSKTRGRLAITQQLMIFAGLTAAFWAGYILSRTADWRLMFGLGVIPAVILIAFRFELPESPRWLLLKGRIPNVKKVLDKLGIHSTDEELMTESHRIIKERESIKLRNMFKEKPILRMLFVIGIFGALSDLTGINVILYYGPYIYKYIGLSGSRAILNTAISESLGGIEYIFAFILIDKWGRRGLGILGYAGMFGSFLIMILGISYFDSHLVYIASILIFVAITLFLLFFHLGPGGLVWVLRGEVIPTEYRSSGTGLISAFVYIANFSIVFAFPIWKAAYGVFSFFIFETAMTLFAVIFVIAFLPETKNISVDQMRELFSKKLSILRKSQIESAVNLEGPKK